jgi:hypothetical protein
MANTRFEQYARIGGDRAPGDRLLPGPAALHGRHPLRRDPVLLHLAGFVTLRTRLGGRSWLAALVIVLILILALVFPVALAGQSIVVHSGEVVEMVRGFLDQRSTYSLPAFIRDMP